MGLIDLFIYLFMYVLSLGYISILYIDWRRRFIDILFNRDREIPKGENGGPYKFEIEPKWVAPKANIRGNYLRQ